MKKKGTKQHFRQKSSKTTPNFKGVTDKEKLHFKNERYRKKKKITALRVRKLSPTLLLTELSQR